MAAVLDRVPLDAIRAQAREIRFAEAVVRLLLLPFVIVGWLAGKVWGAVALAAAAVKVGWQMAQASTTRPVDDGGG